MMTPALGFVIVRHVNSVETNLYWQEAYQSIRNYYSAPILIVDDHSHAQYLRSYVSLINTTIIQSAYRGRAEILGYYYFYQTRFAAMAVILHDSVFIQRYIDFNELGPLRSLWSFDHRFDNDTLTESILGNLDHASEIIDIYRRKHEWVGFFGSMALISWDLLAQAEHRYKLFGTMLRFITDRESRSMLERILPCVFHSISPSVPPIIGDIFDHGWGLTYVNHKRNQRQNYSSKSVPSIVKVWTGR